MRIAVWHNLPSGGGKRALYNHVKALKGHGHYLEGWTTDYASHDYLPLSDTIKEHSKPITNKLENLKKIKSPIIKTIKTINLIKDHCKECVEEIEKEGFDLIFANSCGITYIPYIGMFTKIPVITYLGEPNRILYEASDFGNIWELPAYDFSLRGINRLRKDFLVTYSRRIQVREEIKAAKSCRRLLVNSLYSRESIKRAYGINSEVCYLGVDEKWFQVNNDVLKKPFVVGMGSIGKGKNVDMAIRVISKIPIEQRPQLKWISNCFSPDYFNEITILAEKLGVDFFPLINIKDEKLMKVLSEAAVMIYTSHLEPFGLAPIEANMCGTSVVGIAEGGIRESIKNQENGFLVNGYHLNEMANLILPFIIDNNYAKQMGQQARGHALKYWNWKQMADNIENELQSIMNET
jgi:glycosyltransferase involved in cell wall biosynthesis